MSTAASRAEQALLADVVILVRDTVLVCARLFPRVLAVWLLGWLGSELALRAATIVGDRHGWAALVIFSTSFLFTLVAIVVILRLCGDELGIRALIPASEAADDDRDSSLTRLLAVTLLPFLGLYSAFGQVDAAAARLDTEQLFRNGVLSDNERVLAVVRGLATAHPWRLLALLVGLYVLRRLVDAAHERTRWRPLGLGVAMVESLFILVVIFGGFVLFQRATGWLGNRVLVGWLDAVGRLFHRLLALVHVQLPAAFDRLVGFLADPLGPLLWTVVSQPIIWLAVAALVYGSQVLSLAELWRKGQPLAGRLPGASRFDRPAARRALRPTPPPGLARVGSEVREAFLGDLDDKYLPTVHSLRLVLRAGMSFLGAYVLVYTAVLVAQADVERLYQWVLGGRQVEFWYVADPFLDLLKSVPWELLRLCLLAVAFRRCLELFHRRAAPEDRDGPPALVASASLPELVEGPVPPAQPRPSAGAPA